MMPDNKKPLEGDALLRELRAQDGHYDGHTHSNVSDGHETLMGLCRMAAARGIAHLGITDHDNPLHPRKARVLSLRCGIDVIPGVELNAVHKVMGRTVLVHLGLLWVPADDGELNALIARNQALPMERYVKAMLQRLYELGVDPSGCGVERSWEMLKERNPYCKYPGKGAVADLLVETGFAASREEVSRRWLGEHGERLAYVDKTELFDYVTMAEVLSCVGRLNRERDTAVVVTLNHPFHYGLEREEQETLLEDFSRLGGHAVEVYYPKHDRVREKRLLDLCIQHRLLANVGSDYHYDAHALVKGEYRLFASLLRLHRKEWMPEGKRWW